MQVPITEREFYVDTSSLQTTENASAAVATAPRISKDFIESQLATVLFATGDDLVAGATAYDDMTPGSPPWAADAQMRAHDGLQPKFAHHTICMLTTKAGFTVIGHSAPASPENFNAELGRQFAYENAFRQLWPLFAFTLLEVNAFTGDGTEWMNAGAVASAHPDGFK
jgi:hypothetical protein